MKSIVLLATDDSSLATMVAKLTRGAGCELISARTAQEAIGLFSREPASAIDGKLAVVDLDVHDSPRTLVRTAGGMLPVIAVTSRPSSWLASLQRHHRICATLRKPVTYENLRRAFDEAGHVKSPPEPSQELSTIQKLMRHLRHTLAGDRGLDA